MKESILSHQEPKKHASNKLVRNNKTVSLQCNLIKDLPKLSFGYKSNVYTELQSIKLKSKKKTTVEQKA